MLSRIAAVIVSCMMIIGFLSARVEADSGPVRIMVLPFEGASAGNYSYLTDSIRAMVSTRLSAENEVELADYTLSAEDLRQLADGEVKNSESLFSRFKVDYVIAGALYELQTGLKIQVSLLHRDPAENPMNISVLAGNEEKIITAVEDLVSDIIAKGLGIQAVEIAARVESGSDSEGSSGFATEHPDKIYKKGVYEGSIVAEGETVVRAHGVRRSSSIPAIVVAMATADLDGDGTIEVVSASRTTVEIYRFNETRFEKLAEYRFSSGYKIHAVNIADLDANGSSEIFISANDDDRAASAIFRWDGVTSLIPLAVGIDWYIRPIVRPGKGMILLGQKSSNDPKEGFVKDRIATLQPLPGFSGVREGEPVGLPKNVRLFDFVWADLDGNGLQEIVAVDSREKLLVFDGNNSLIYASDEDYGGSRNFYGQPISAMQSMLKFRSRDSEETFDRVIAYIPTKLLVADFDNDGRQEIIVGKNKRQWSKWLSRSREYDGGAVACLSWRESGMQEVWKTNTINGYIADYDFVVEPSNAKGTVGQSSVSLYVSQVPDKSLLGFMMHSESKLLKYELDVLSAERKKGE